jgi:non-ribosomal peptide synthetase component E (peptide arylation enzyme)
MMMNRVWLQKSAILLDMKNSSSCFMRLHGRGMASLTGGQKVEELAKQLPFKNAIRYEHKNQKYSFKDINQHSEDLACGFLEQGFQPGDIVLSWLPEHFSEQVRLTG